MAKLQEPFGLGDYLLSFTMRRAQGFDYARPIVVSRISPAPGTLALLLPLGLMRRRR